MAWRERAQMLETQHQVPLTATTASFEGIETAKKHIQAIDKKHVGCLLPYQG